MNGNGYVAWLVLGGVLLVGRLFAQEACPSKDGFTLYESRRHTQRAESVDIDSHRKAIRVVPSADDAFQWPYLLWYDEQALNRSNAVLLVETVNTGRLSDVYPFTEEQALHYWHLSLERWD